MGQSVEASGGSPNDAELLRLDIGALSNYLPSIVNAALDLSAAFTSPVIERRPVKNPFIPPVRE